MLMTHQKFFDLAPIKAFCTIRFNAYLSKDGNVELQSAFFKLSLGHIIDNLSSGLGISVNIKTGFLEKFGYSFYDGDLRRTMHPDGKTSFAEFSIPYWDQTVELVKQLNLLFPKLRNISWDIGITQDGPVVVEGNSGGGIFFTQLICKPYYQTTMIQENLIK